MDHFLIKYLLKHNFVEVSAWHTYKHESGLVLNCDEHEWSVDHDKKGWSEIGSLNDTETIYKLIEKYCS